jgi:hypothetical protein
MVTVIAGLALLAARSPALTVPDLQKGRPDAVVGAMGVGFILALVNDAGQGLGQKEKPAESGEKGELDG